MRTLSLESRKRTRYLYPYDCAYSYLTCAGLWCFVARQLLPSWIHKTVTFYEVVTVRRGFCMTTTGSVQFPFFPTVGQTRIYVLDGLPRSSLSSFSISGLSSGEWIAGFLAFPIFLFFVFFFLRWSGVKSFSYYYRVLRCNVEIFEIFFNPLTFIKI